jgi:hypothetical protein
MIRKIINFILIFLIILIPSKISSEPMKSIFILVDELKIETIEELDLEKSNIGLINLKTRPPYSEEGLYLSVNIGRKLSLRDFGKTNLNLEYLGDVLSSEKTSYIGNGKGGLLISNKDRKTDYEENFLDYDLDWLKSKTDKLLNKSNILLLEYNIEDEKSNIEILKEYLTYYSNKKIIILPKKVATGDKYFLNKYLVPIIYIDGENNGLLTSNSTKREGFVAIEDISAQVKNTYGYTKKSDIGKPFKILEAEDPITEINKLYKTNMNLLITAYLFQGMTYLSIIILCIGIIKFNKISHRLYFVYSFISTNVLISLILGLFELHQNIVVYLIMSMVLPYIITRLIIKKKLDFVKIISSLTYISIVLGIIIYPKMIYNSYIGFNNLVYGARYYGLNNGIMGVLLASSILFFFNITKNIENVNLKKIIGVIIFTLNMITLSTHFGANTGGFITSVALFGFMIYMLFLSKKDGIKKIIMFLLIGLLIFGVNMIFDILNEDNTHAISFFYRIKENGVSEFIFLVLFKAKELIKLTLIPPFSFSIIAEIIILRRLYKYIMSNDILKKEAVVMLFTSILGFLINDTGAITFLYMNYYLILDIISRRVELEH